MVSRPKKSRGGRAAGQEPTADAGMPSSLIKSIDAWAERNAGGSRSEALRRLVELGLTASRSAKQPNPKSAAKASRMAAEQIDKLVDSSMPEAERHARKRQLIKGPKEFREIRGDQPKPKGRTPS